MHYSLSSNHNVSIFPEENDVEMNRSAIHVARPVETPSYLGNPIQSTNVSVVAESYENQVIRNIPSFFLELRESLNDRMDVTMINVNCQLTTLVFIIIFLFFFNIVELVMLNHLTKNY